MQNAMETCDKWNRNFLALVLFGTFGPIFYTHLHPPIHKQFLGKSRSHNSASSNQTHSQFSEIMEDFGLYLRMTSNPNLTKLYFHTLVPSMKYFWFLPVNLTVVLDDTPEDRNLSKELAASYPYPKICFEKWFDPVYYHSTGKSLSQLSMFYVENCFDKKYVGFIDTDTMFITSVTPELLFNGTRPIAIGHYGKPLIRLWWKKTLFALGLKEVFTFMDYFPVVLKVQHIIELRNYISTKYNSTFLDIFHNISIGRFSQFNIMGNYVWYFHREEYQFHAQLVKRQRWNRMKSLERPLGTYYDEHLTEQMITPFPRASVHSKYRKTWKLGGQAEMLRSGLCYSGGFQWCPFLCKSLNNSKLHTDLFVFGPWVDWTWDNRCLKSQKLHYTNVQNHYSKLIKDKIIAGCQEIAVELNLTVSSLMNQS